MVTWHYLVGQERQGPLSDDELAGLVRSGAIRRETFVWKYGFDGWRHAGEVLGSVFADVGPTDSIRTSGTSGKSNNGPRRKYWAMAFIAVAAIGLVPAAAYLVHKVSEEFAATQRWTNPISGKTADIPKSWTPTVNSEIEFYFTSASGHSVVGFEVDTEKDVDLEELSFRASTEDVARDADWKTLVIEGQEAMRLTGTQGGSHEMKGSYVEITIAVVGGYAIISHAYYDRPQAADEPRSEQLVQTVFSSTM
jgi:hypothetical protein